MKPHIFIILAVLLYSGISSGQTSPSNSHSLILSKLDEKGQIEYINQQVQSLTGKNKHSILDIGIPLAMEKGWTNEAIDWYRQRGVQTYYDGDYPKALEAYQTSLKLAKELGSDSQIGRTYNELGVFSMKQMDIEKSKEYLGNAYKACEKAKDSLGMSTSLDNQGMLYAKINELEKAKAFFLQTLDIRVKIRDSIGLGYVYNNLADIASRQGRHQEALQLLENSTNIRQELGDTMGVAINICNMGELAFAKGDYENAITYFEKSLRKAEETEFIDLMQWILNQSSKVYIELGEAEKAHQYLSRSFELKDSLLGVEKLAQITEMETKYETAEKEKVIEQQKRQFQTTVIASIALFIIGLLGFLSYRSRQKAQLAEEQRSYQEKLLENTLETQEKERKRIAKDLHDGVGQQLSGLKMGLQQLTDRIGDDQQAGTLKQLTSILDDATTDVRNLSHQMMPRTLQEYGLKVALEDMVEKSLGNSGLDYDFSAFRVDERYDEGIEIGMYRVCQELLHNIQKHANAKEVSIQLMKSKGRLVLTVEDDGKGFDMQQLRHKGHGLMNIQSRVQAMGGTVDFESTPGKGTVVRVRVLNAE